MSNQIKENQSTHMQAYATSSLPRKTLTNKRGRYIAEGLSILDNYESTLGNHVQKYPRVTNLLRVVVGTPIQALRVSK